MNDMQTIVRDFCIKHNLGASKNSRLLDLVSETGELAKEFLKATSYGQKNDFIKNDKITLEFGDLFFSLLALANSLDIDAKDALFMALAKYEQRIKSKNSPSS
jgi:NTP pyrophosphatase (non-canonical NTP hydrolase)